MPNWAIKVVSDFCMFKQGGYLPWVHDPVNTPRRRTMQAFRILSLAWTLAQTTRVCPLMGEANG